MKKLSLLLFILIIGYSFSEDTTCPNVESKKEQKCRSINTSCRYSTNQCFKTGDCTKGTIADCSTIIPEDFNTYKCGWDESCKKIRKTCGDYQISKGDTCSQLYPGDGNGKRCEIRGTTCEVHYDVCDGLAEDKCETNIPKDYKTKCVWDGTTCQTKTRECNDNFVGIQNNLQTICPLLVPTEAGKAAGKKCVYTGTTCIEYFEKCSDYTGTDRNTCKAILPLNSDKSGYDILKKCDLNNENKCTEMPKECSDFVKGTDDPDICNAYQPTDSTKMRCVYDYKAEADDNPCKEEYKSCGTYNSETGKNKEDCEKIILIETSKKCAYENEQCVVRDRTCDDWEEGLPEKNCTDIKLTGNKHCRYIARESTEEAKCIEDFNSCNDYKGTDKETCIKISSESCYLDKDSICTKVAATAITCSAAGTDEDKCLNEAKPSDPNKKCLYYGGSCYEDYEKCEDYKEGNPSDCTSIVLHNGKKCVFDSNTNKCKSIKKVCSEARDQRECGIIFKSGVSNPARYRCEYYLTACVERNMYCSDYKRNSATECALIKPYDMEGNNIEVFSKCEIRKANVGCERVLKKCNEANGSPSLCQSISEKLEHNTDGKKYCFYLNGLCKEQFTSCSLFEVIDWAEGDTFGELCSTNIPKNYLNYHCVADTDEESGDQICKSVENECSTFNTIFNTIDYGDFCLESNSLCSYSPLLGTCSKIEGECNEITFAVTDYARREEACKSISVSDPNKMCSLKNDFSGCEEVEKTPTPLDPDAIDNPEEEETEKEKEKEEEKEKEKEKEPEKTETDKPKTEPSEQNSQTQSQGNSWGGKLYGINFALVILCLLI